MRALTRDRPGGLPAAPPLAAALLATALLAPLSPLAAQEEAGTVVGQVVDARREAPVGFARVEIPALDRRTEADAEGRFRFPEVPPGTYDLRVSFLGFATTVRELAVEAGETARAEIRVLPGPVEVADLEVSALALSWYPGFVERRESREGHFITRREIAREDPSHLTRLLHGREGVRVGFHRRPHGYSKFFPQFYYQGPGYERFCYPAIFVDGDQIGPGKPYWYLNEIPPDRVLAMEVYYLGREVPESVPFTEYRGPADGAPEDLAGLDRRGAVGPERRRRRFDPGVRQVLAGAGLLEGLRTRVPRYDEELDRTVMSGLYPQLPRIEHCGAIFVWTRFHPYE